MQILVIDGQGEMLGSELVSEIRKNIKNAEITAVGTNIRATESMLKAGWRIREPQVRIRLSYNQEQFVSFIF